MESRTAEAEKRRAALEASLIPIPGRIHPCGLEESVAKEFGYFPCRAGEGPMDGDGKRADIYVCDRSAYDFLNAALAQGSELGAWVDNKLRLGHLFVHENFDNVPGWDILTSHGKPCAQLNWWGRKAAIKWLEDHHSDKVANCLSSTIVFADTGPRNDSFACYLQTVMVTANQEFREVVKQDYGRLQETFMKLRAVDKENDVPFRLWFLKEDGNTSYKDEECLNPGMQDWSYGGTAWHRFRIVKSGFSSRDRLQRIIQRQKSRIQQHPVEVPADRVQRLQDKQSSLQPVKDPAVAPPHHRHHHRHHHHDHDSVPRGAHPTRRQAGPLETGESHHHIHHKWRRHKKHTAARPRPLKIETIY